MKKAQSIFDRIASLVPPYKRRLERKKMSWASYVRWTLNQEGITVTEFANKLGVSVPYASRIVHGLENVTLETISKVEETLSRDTLMTPFEVRAKIESDMAFRSFVMPQKSLMSYVMPTAGVYMSLTIGQSAQLQNYDLPSWRTRNARRFGSKLVDQPTSSTWL